METLKDYLEKELGLTFYNDDGLSSMKLDLALVKSELGSYKKGNPIQEEDFLIEMGEHTEPEIRKKMREYYSRFEGKITDDGIMIEDFCDFSVKMGGKGTASITATTFSYNRMQVTVNIW